MKKRMPPKLRRSLHKREPLRRFIIFCEGKNTEPSYFVALKQANKKALIDIDITGGCGVPYTIAEKASAEAERLGLNGKGRRKLNSFEERDEIWAVFDRDEHPRFEEAITLCRSRSVKVAHSNPCFELWLILHFCDFDRPDGRKSVQKFLRGLRPEYDPDQRKILNCEELLPNIEAAEKRAKNLLDRREQERSPFGPPSSTVGHLTQAIREAAELAQKGGQIERSCR